MNVSAIAKVVAAATEVATARLRRSRGSSDLEGLVRDTMEAREIPEHEYESVLLIAGMLLSFADGVRSAERRGDTISGYYTENEEATPRPLIVLPDEPMD
jgi:hypothetical protein